MYMSPCIFAILRSLNIFFFANFEPARFYILSYQEEMAKRSLDRIYKSEYVNKVYEKEKRAQAVETFSESWSYKYRQ